MGYYNNEYHNSYCYEQAEFSFTMLWAGALVAAGGGFLTYALFELLEEATNPVLPILLVCCLIPAIGVAFIGGGITVIELIMLVRKLFTRQ